MRRKIWICIVYIFLILTGCNFKNKQKGIGSLPPKTPSFTIIYTANLKGVVLPFFYRVSKKPVYHFSQVQEIIKRVKSTSRGTIFLVDAGNSLAGYDEFCKTFNGEPMLKLMKKYKYDVVSSWVDIPVKPPYEKYPFLLYKKRPYIVKHIGDFKISFLWADRFTTKEDLIRSLKESSANFNILLCQGEKIKEWSKIKDIHLIIPSTFQDTPPKKIAYINSTAIAPYVDSRFEFGKIEISSKGIQVSVIPSAGADPIIPKEDISLISPYISKFQKKYGKDYNTIVSMCIGYGDKGMIHPLKTLSNSPVGSFVADCMRAKTKTDIAIINHLAIRNSLQGIISANKIAETLPFDNTLVTMDLTGRDIYEIMQSVVQHKKTLFQVSGMEVKIDFKHKQISLFKDGQPLQKDRTYRVVTIDYLVSSNKEKYKPFKKGKRVHYTGICLNYVVFDYITKFPYVVSPPKRILTGENKESEKHRLYNITWMWREGKASILKKNQNPIILGFMAYSKGDFKKAIHYFKDENKTVEKLFYAMSLYRMGRLKESYTSFLKLSQRDPFFKVFISCFPYQEKSKGLGEIYWRTFGGNFKRDGRSKFLGPQKGKIAWRFKTYHTLQSSPAVTENSIIVSGGDGFLYSLKKTGTLRWKIRLGKVLLASPTISSNVIYIGSDNGNLYAVSSEGKVLWKYSTGGWIISTPAIDHNRIYFGSNDHHLYALTKEGKLLWKLNLPHEVFSSPAIDRHGNIIVGCLDKNLYAISPEGKIIWKFKCQGKIYSTPAISEDDTIVFGSDDGYIYALTPKGKLEGKFKTADFVPSSPAIDKEGNVYIGSEDHYLYALNLNGNLMWKFKTEYEIFGSPAIDKNGNIYFGSDDTSIYALNKKGKLMWKVKTGKYVESSPAIDKTGRIYIGSDDGYLYCIE